MEHNTDLCNNLLLHALKILKTDSNATKKSSSTTTIAPWFVTCRVAIKQVECSIVESQLPGRVWIHPLYLI